MRIDVVSVFSEYFEVMNLSLMGKAQAKGLLEVKAYNLRDWTHGVHRSVDDTPAGGGAGMVTKSEVWSEYLDELLGFSQPSCSLAPSGAPALTFPNPSVLLFTQHDAAELNHTDHLLFGCGRYEGYNARIPDYYHAQGVDVCEYPIGGHVLNGGKVAVSVMLGTITHLIPGFVGNPDSIIKESYTGEGALLEHRRYIKPAVWHGIVVPDVLLSDDHGKVDRFRHDEVLTRTAEIRPDLIATLDCKALDKANRKILMALG